MLTVDDTVDISVPLLEDVDRNRRSSDPTKKEDEISDVGVFHEGKLCHNPYDRYRRQGRTNNGSYRHVIHVEHSRQMQGNRRYRVQKLPAADKMSKFE